MVQLAAAHLQGGDAVPAAHVPSAAMHAAVAWYGAGFAYDAGEVPLALLETRFAARGAQQGAKVSCVVTDRRLVGRFRASNVPDTAVDVPFAQVTGVSAERGPLAQGVRVQLGAAEARVPVFARTLERFFAALTQLPPAYRALPPAFPQPTPADPTSALAAHAAWASGDMRVPALLRVIDAGGRAGALSQAETLGMVRAAWLLDRALRFGRGMSRGLWRVALPAPVLVRVLRATLGTPFREGPDGPAYTMDVHPPGGGSGTGSAVASTVLGLASLAVLGVGWISFARGSNLRALRIACAPEPDGGASLALLGTDGGVFRSLAAYSPALLDALSQGLFALEARLLLAQAALGPARPPDELLAAPPALVAERAAALVGGPLDLRAFAPSAAR